MLPYFCATIDYSAEDSSQRGASTSMPIKIGQQDGVRRTAWAAAAVELRHAYPALPVAWSEHRVGRFRDARKPSSNWFLLGHWQADVR